MRDQPTAPQVPLPSTPSAPVMRANAAESLSAAASSPSSKRRAPRRSYAAVWATAGLLSAAYVGVLLVGQEPVTTMAARWSAQERDTSEMAAALARTQTEVAQLQRSVGALEIDMSRVKSKTVEIDARDRQAASRVDAIEQRVERFSSQIAQTLAKGGAAQKGGRGAAIETAALPPVQTKEAPAGRELAATRIAPPEASVGTAPQPQPAAPSAAILLARGPSLDALRLSWSLLNERHKAALGVLEPRVLSTEAGIYQLVAGPFATPAEASKACATLKSRGVTCQPAEFKGEGL